MESRQTKHYDLWSLSQSEKDAREKTTSLRDPNKSFKDGLSTQTGKPDDLQTWLLLYSYGVPIDVALTGICTLPSGNALNCKTKSISSELVELAYLDSISARCGKEDVGLPVQIDLDEIGAVKGVISSQDRVGFQVAVDANGRDSLAKKLADLASQRSVKHDVSIPTGDTTKRIELTNKNCSFDDQNGRLRHGIIVNLSQVDALVRAQFIPPKPAIIVFRGQRRYAAEITSVFAMGFMAKFSNPISDKDFSAGIQFTD